MGFIDAVTEFAWIGWLVLIALFLVIEMFTLEFTFLMLALGSVVGIATSGFAPLWLQVILAAIAAVLLLVFLKPPLLRRLHRGEDPAKSNIDALIGIQGIALSEVSSTDGQAKLANGEIWSARTDGPPLPRDSRVTVTSIQGAIAMVIPSAQEGHIA